MWSRKLQNKTYKKIRTSVSDIVSGTSILLLPEEVNENVNLFLCGWETSFSGSTQRLLDRPSKAAPNSEPSAFRPWDPGVIVPFAGEEMEACSKTDTCPRDCVADGCPQGSLSDSNLTPVPSVRTHPSAEAAQGTGSPEGAEGIPHILHPQVNFWLTACL